MIYAMSDLHGCYDNFIGILGQIHFHEGNTPCILGYIVGRSAHGIKLLLDLMERKILILAG